MLVGKAYFFFDSEASKDKITSELDRVRKHPSFSETLELTLMRKNSTSLFDQWCKRINSTKNMKQGELVAAPCK